MQKITAVESKMEKMTDLEALCEFMINELYEIKCHFCNQREFEAGVGLGGLISALMIRQDNERMKRKENVTHE